MQPNVKTELREFLNLAIPLASAQVAQSATGFVDTIIMGRLGQETLAAGGLAAITFTALLNSAGGVVIGVSPLVAQAYGAGCKPRIEQVARHGLWLALMLTIPVMILLGNIDTLMRSLGQQATTVALAKTYLDIMLWGLFPALAFATLRSVVSALAHARPIMFIVIGGTLFNLAGNYVLGFGKFGFPAMGLRGLGVASILSLWGMFLSLVVYILQHKELKNYHLFANLHQLKLPIFAELIFIGAPIGVSAALETGLFTVVTYLMGALGTEVLAAHQIILQTIIVIFMIPLGMSFATTIRVGQWSGQRNFAAAQQAGYVGIASGVVFMTVMAIALLVFPLQIVGLYIDIHAPENATLLTAVMPMLTIAAVAQILDSVQKTASGALYGLKDTRIPMLLSFGSFWGVGLTSGYLLGFRFGLGGTGLWLGQSIGVAIAAAVFVWRFQQLSSSRT